MQYFISFSNDKMLEINKLRDKLASKYIRYPGEKQNKTGYKYPQ